MNIFLFIFVFGIMDLLVVDGALAKYDPEYEESLMEVRKKLGYRGTECALPGQFCTKDPDYPRPCCYTSTCPFDTRICPEFPNRLKDEF